MNLRTTGAAASVILCASLLTACSAINPGARATDEREIGDVTAVELDTSGDLVVTLGDEPSLTITAGDRIIDDLTSETDGGVLRLGRKSWGPGTVGPIRYELTVPKLEGVTISGSGDVDADFSGADAVKLAIRGSGDIHATNIDATSLTITLEGSGDITVDGLAADDVTAHIEGSGNITLSGEATEQSLTIEGAGDYDAEELKTVDTIVRIEGSGDVDVFATGTLTANIDGSGSIRYSGDPRVDKSIDGAGEVVPAG
ncbi:Putative auto-transporter adhesin, head GIN domain [Paramicrobacterium humi]|uniref:Putative auto-transporter adhesin, head GIN domain n=1 Tax=Paramicrobacterium humi TaxID=640635 RepID=A0A1H4KVR1_9MICO|nr:head GIN domain-containing protein [Microbacterium humi]SEB62296.1 Putative auto-transporter adhesin, head GIN domain [Microbacterium humi]